MEGAAAVAVEGQRQQRYKEAALLQCNDNKGGKRN